MTNLAQYPPTAFVTDIFRRTSLQPVIIEFHNTSASLSTRLWPLVDRFYDTKKDEKAWSNTVKQIEELIRNELPSYGYTSYIWDEKFDKTFITPMRDGKPPLIKKKGNLEHYEEEKKNLENFRTHIEYLLIENVSHIYHSQICSK